MSDVSITDLIAEARAEQIMSERITRYREAACDALGGAGWEINSEDELDEALLALVGQASRNVESVTAPTKPPVHNHGPTEGRGLDCNESVVGGFLQGACMRVTEQTDPFSQSPHMAAKYWGELVKARNRITEVEEELADMSALAQVNAMNVSDYLDAIEDAKQARAELAAIKQSSPDSEPTQ